MTTTNTPTLTIVAPNGATLTLDLSAMLSGLPTSVTSPAPKQDRTQSTKVDRTPSAKAPAKAAKTPKAPRTKRASRKGDYETIRSLTAAGQHDEAIAHATSLGWSHVIDSIEAHRAKHGKQAEAGTATASITRKAPSAPKGKRAKGAKAPAKAPAAPTTEIDADQVFPGSCLTEADLVEHWALCITRGHGDIAQAALRASRKALMAFVKAGDKANVHVQNVRIRTLEHLLSEAGLSL